MTYTGEATPTASVEGAGEPAFEPFSDAEGNPTMLVNSAFGMGPNPGMGKGSGHVEAFDLTFDSTWGRVTEVEFAR
jgi:hypothetical protein